MTKPLSKLQCWIRPAQHEWLRGPHELEGSTRTRDIARVGIQSEIVRLALDLVMRNPQLLRVLEPRRESRLVMNFLERLERQLAAPALDEPRLTALAGLPATEQQVIKLHLGLEDGRCLTFEEIGAELSVTRQRAQQIYKRALGLLRKPAVAVPPPAVLAQAQGVGLGGFVDPPREVEDGR